MGPVAIGHGLFSLLDAFPFQHPESPELAVSIPVANRIFGQGARASFDNVRVPITDKMLKANDAYVNAADYSAIPGMPAPRPAAPVGTSPAAGGAAPSTQLGAATVDAARGRVGLDFSLQQEARVRLSVYDLQGRTLATLADGTLAPGAHRVTWDGTSSMGATRSGVYFARLEVGGRQYVRRFAIIR